MRALGASRTSLVPGGVLAGPWVRDPLWRNARAVPSLDLRFADNKSLIDAVTGASLVTFTRASSGTFVNSDGVLQTAATDVPRFDHNPTTGESLGLLVEEARTNLLLNSGTLSTQSVTVTAVAHTLHFTGTGTITLTGASTAGPLVGTGAGEANRVSLTFTPTAGSLTLTVSGTVTNAQLEAGAFRTSYISTTAATVTRAADVASISNANLIPWLTSFDENTFYAELRGEPPKGLGGIIMEGLVSSAIGGATLALNNTSTRFRSQQRTGPSRFDGGNNNGSLLTNTINRVALGTSALGSQSGENGLLPTAFTSPAQADWDPGSALSLGKRSISSTVFLNGCIARFTYWPTRLANTTLQQITQP